MNQLEDKLVLLEKVLRIPGVSSTLESHELDSLPLWIKKTIKIHFLAFGQTKVYLIEAKGELSYDQLVSARAHLERRFGATVLVNADKQNPKYRSVFVRTGVPFIYRDKMVFAPSLGVKIDNIKIQNKRVSATEIDKDLSPFEFKLVAGYLINQLTLKKFNLNDLQNILGEKGYETSKTKLSKSINNLINLGLLAESGRGPNRILNFKKKDEVWKALHELTMSKTHRTVVGQYKPSAKQVVLSGENALSHFSTLAEPKSVTYAMTKRQYENIKQDKKSGGEIDKIFYEIRKEDPVLFSVEDCLNPIELYFNLKNIFDERVHIALDEMLSKYDLEGVYRD